MAPESILRDEYDFGVDIWGLGCSVFEMLTKRVLRNISNSKVKDKGFPRKQKIFWRMDEEISLISTSEFELPEDEEDLEWLMKPMLLINPSAALQKRKRFLSDDSVSESSTFKRPKRFDLDRVIKPLGCGILQPCC
ncbi:OLC1v1030986C1 [Oldenlandia corymbosa var. corymbosa]|uniref:OLC1v1030986C1 n=1 Tax=Oldenlandia corymbosa var. corymbosa TaxID=529605 RepID=A0AAV1CI47_OLDCO|nr:OLC1v1030986C1 [Oldenlandia corymbosa var. corymbosa]